LKADEVRIPRARVIVAAAAILGALAILALTHNFNFYFDEWDFILGAPDWSWTSYLQPHNEHPVMLPRLAYTALLNTVGMRAYWPYMALLLLLHGINVVLVFELIRRRSGDLIAIAAAALLLFLGAGWENLLWAFQITFVGSVACGLGAFLVLDRRRGRASMPAVTALTAASVMFSGVGLFFVAGVAAYLLAGKDRRRDLLWLVPLAAAILIWYVAFGRSGTPANPPPTAKNLLLAPVYLVWGLGEGAAGLFGEGGWWGPVALLAAAAAVAWSWRRRRPDPFVIGTAAALVSLYFVTGLSRAQFGYQQSGAGRYVYEGAVLWLLLLGDASRGLPWRGTWRPALAACVFLACFNSAALLFEYAAAKTVQMQREAADLQALTYARDLTCAKSTGGPDPLVMPQVQSSALYYRAVDRYGDPAQSGAPADVADFRRALANLERPPCL
jgi:hypothetical protein